jgi:23S rRNA (guanosine2251-2'-O)-methyltransferase
MLDKRNTFIYGKKVVGELLRSNHPVTQIVLARESEDRFIRQIESLAEKRNLPITYVRKTDIQRFCGPVVHQGIAALLESYIYLDEEVLYSMLNKEKYPLILILDQVQDPHNLGAIIRSAEASGVNAVVLSRKGSSDITPTVAKTSAGAVFHLAICSCNDLFNTLKSLKRKGLFLVGLHPGGKQTIYQFDMKRSLALIIGSEGEGIRKNVLNYCDDRVTIPQLGKVNSLNASVATAVTLYEIVRQRTLE